MMYAEFVQRTHPDASYAIFEKFEPMYMASAMDKDAFCEMIKPSVDKLVKEEKDLIVRKMVKVAVGDCRFCSVFDLCVDLGRDANLLPIVKKTGFKGCGEADYTELQVHYRKGVVKLTKAEREVIRQMDVRDTW